MKDDKKYDIQEKQRREVDFGNQEGTKGRERLGTREGTREGTGKGERVSHPSLPVGKDTTCLGISLPTKLEAWLSCHLFRLGELGDDFCFVRSFAVIWAICERAVTLFKSGCRVYRPPF